MNALRNLSKLLVLIMLSSSYYVSAQEAASSPAMEKFQQDMKTAVLNGSITVAQVKQLQADAETLKAAKAEQAPGSPVDLRFFFELEGEKIASLEVIP